MSPLILHCLYGYNSHSISFSPVPSTIARTKRTLPTNSPGAAYRIIRASQVHLHATAAAAATAAATTTLNTPVVTTTTRGGGQRAAAVAVTTATALNPPVMTLDTQDVPRPVPPVI